jgi:chorismate mutase / prephenate dehydratase
MSSLTSPTESTPPTADAEEPAPPDHWRSEDGNGLAALRATLDRIDERIHDLLMERAHVVEDVAKTGKRAALRPGREASIIRRLLARHTGALPPQAIVRIWRELLAATTSMQGSFTLAVCDPHPGCAYTQLAREQYGALTPLRVHGGAAQAIAELSAGTASVAVLPMPSETETWWRTALLHADIHVVARLPFWAPRPEGAPTVQALVVAPFLPDGSEHDRSFIGLELAEDVSRARLTTEVTAAGFAPGMVLLRRERGAGLAHALVEVEGHVATDDKRLDGLSAQRRALALGGYAVPVRIA